MSDSKPIICLKSSLLAGFLLVLQSALAQVNPAELDQEIQARQKMLGKDLVVMIWKRDDTLVYKKETGEFNSKTQAPLYNASTWLTAALVMQFVDEGKLSLDDKVSRFLPEFEKYGKNYITIGLCLSHMTGIKDESTLLGKIFQRRKPESLEDEVNSFAAREIRTNPGTDFWYGSIGPNIAGRVLEVISKKKFDVLIKTKLLNPMGMRKTTFTNIDNSAVSPASGAVSTADDYMRFLVMLMNKGKYGGKQILTESSVDELLRLQPKTEQIKFAPKPTLGFGYALGSWAISSTDNKATVLACPGMFGSWPMIDFCRGYAYFAFTKNLPGEDKQEAHLALKKLVDTQLPGPCPGTP